MMEQKAICRKCKMRELVIGAYCSNCYVDKFLAGFQDEEGMGTKENGWDSEHEEFR